MPRMLLADDEAAFRLSLALRLRMRGYEVTEASDGNETLRAVREDGGIEVVILDWSMPGMKGNQVLAEINRLRPEAAVIILTGYGAGEIPGAWSSHQKPCDLEELIRAIESARRGRAGYGRGTHG